MNISSYARGRLESTAAIFPEWLRLPERYQIVGKHAHDTRLVAAMNVHGFQSIATFNGKDFARYVGVQVLSPERLATARPVTG